jgi:hypothetical protein
VDNGTPWGSAGDLPTDLALWLIGLGPEVAWNPPRRPQDNGVIERSQGTGKRWAEPPRCRDVEDLQRRIDEMDRIQRERYPSAGCRSRMESFPALAHSGRPYTPEQETTRWQLGPVLEHVGRYTVIRTVDSSGSISLYNRSRYVGAMLGGRRVFVTLDPGATQWVVADKDGVCYHRLPATELSSDAVTELRVSNQRIRPRQNRHKHLSEFPAQARVR